MKKIKSAPKQRKGHKWQTDRQKIRKVCAPLFLSLFKRACKTATIKADSNHTMINDIFAQTRQKNAHFLQTDFFMCCVVGPDNLHFNRANSLLPNRFVEWREAVNVEIRGGTQWYN